MTRVVVAPASRPSRPVRPVGPVGPVARLGRLGLVGLLGLVGFASPRPAAAELEAGRRAPDLYASATVQTPVPISVDRLRGRLVLLAFLKSDCPHCRAGVAALNALQRTWFPRGLRVVGAMREGRATVDGFVRDLGVAFPITFVDTEVLRDYDVSGFPSAFLVAPDGRLAWHGPPGAVTDAEVARRLASTPPWPDLPAGFDPLLTALREDRWSEAAAGFGVCSAPDACDAATAAAAATMMTWISRTAEGLLAAAERDLAQGAPYEAWRTLDRLTRGFGAAGVGPRAADRAAAILADPARAREVEAGSAFEAARQRWAAEGRDAGVAALDAVAATHRGTGAGFRAGEMAARLRKRR